MPKPNVYLSFIVKLQVLAQKYGYELPKIENDPLYEMFAEVKDPRQIFYGLEPDWLVNLPEKSIFKPVNDSSESGLKNEATA